MSSPVTPASQRDPARENPAPEAAWTPAGRAALGRFLRKHGLFPASPHGESLAISRIGDGHSNLTYLVTDGTSRVVIRRPPPPPEPPGAHDVLREARLMDALRDTEIPVPTVLATAQAGEVIDVPCFVMSFAEGPVVTTATPAPLNQPPARRQVAAALVDTLASLHAVDWRAAGLESLGRPEGLNARHLRRIGQLVADHRGDLPPHFTPAGRWLADHVPAESGATIVHNDYRLGNVVLAPEPPGRVAAVLDWELATIGDPLMDVAYFLASVPEPGRSRTPVQDMSTAMLEDGYPSREELAARYAGRTGRDLSGITWYSVMVLWKLAALYEYSRRLAARGGGDDYYSDPSLVMSFLRGAHRVSGLGEVPAAGNNEPGGKTR
jgi:aminoglycoside phosphotransferase (APT) family kinase protein